MLLALSAVGILVVFVVLPSVPFVRRVLSRPAYVPPRGFASGVLLTEWTAFTEVRQFEVGRETMGGSATLLAVSESYCEFRFNNYWSASDVGWPRNQSLAGSLHIEPDSALRVQLWTTPGVVALAAVAWGVPAIGFALTFVAGFFTGDWGRFGEWFFGVCVSSAIVAISISGAKRFGEDAVRFASKLEAGA